MSHDGRQCDYPTPSGRLCTHLAIKFDGARWTCGGSHQPPDRSTKIPRNDPCPCGSGLKFKHCCWLQV